MNAIENAKDFIEDFQCSDLKAWMELRKFLLKNLIIEDAKAAVKLFSENNFIDLNSRNFLREVEKNNIKGVIEQFHRSVMENLDYILFGGYDWKTPDIVDILTQIEKSFYPRLKSEIQKHIQQNIFQ